MCACLYILWHLAVQLTCLCCLCDMYEAHNAPWTGGTNVFVLSFAGHCLILSITDLYTFSVEPKWQMAPLWIFATCSSAATYLRTLVSLRHSMVDIPGPWEVLWRFSNENARSLGTTVFNSSLYIQIFHPAPCHLTHFHLFTSCIYFHPHMTTPINTPHL